MDRIIDHNPAVPSGPVLPPNDGMRHPFPQAEPTRQHRDPFEGAVSPVDDPSVMEQVNAVLSQAIGHTEMPPPVSDVVELPVGLYIGGTAVKTARVRELTGADEEAMVAAMASGAMERIADALLSGVVSIGQHSATPDLLDRLTLADRDALLLAIRRVTYGDEVAFEKVRCTQCDKDYELTFDLRDIPIISLEDPAHAVYEVPLRNGRVATVHIPTGADQRTVLEQMRTRNLNAAEQDSVLISRVVEKITGPDGEIPINTVEDARRLSMGDRARLVKEINSKKVGPDYSQAVVDCPECNQKTEVPLSIPVLFRG